jgi:rod shape-determining protein MreC
MPRPAPRPRLVLALLVIAAAVLLAIDLRGDASALRELGAAVAGPPERLAAGAVRQAGSLTGDGGARERVEELERQNARLAAELWAERAARERRTQEQGARTLVPGRRLVTARVIAAREHAVTIDAGTGDGIRADQMVVSADGLVGRVVEAGPEVATVRLLTDPAAAVGVRLTGSREIGYAAGEHGRGDGLLRLRLLDADAPLSAGQQVRTLGSRGQRPYAPGVPVGTIVRVEPGGDGLTRTALVLPSVKPTTLDVVAVVTGGERDAG